MTSAVLASQNDSSWAQTGGGAGGFMGKMPYTNPHLNPNPNPNSNPKKKQKKFHPVNGRHNDDFPAVTTASDDAYSFNQRPIENQSGRNGNGFNHGGYLTFNIATYTKSELNELRKRLVSELEQIQNLRDRIESGHFSTTNTNSNPNPRSNIKPSKKFPGSKRPLLSGSSKDPKKLSQNGFDNRSGLLNMDGLMKECRQILTKLMKHKHGWVFNVPVDAGALGLHDYHQIIKRPMDLGTVKSNFTKNNYYPTPIEFASDVRLTFNNALLYNPKTDAVHGMADQLLARFEELFRPIQEKINGFCGGGTEELQGSFWNHIPTPERIKKPKAKAKAKASPFVPLKKQQNQNHLSASLPLRPPPPSPPLPTLQAESPVMTPSSPPKEPEFQPEVQEPEFQPEVQEPEFQPEVQEPEFHPEVQQHEVVQRVAVTKLPKPRARDPNKRDMSMEEKHKLGVGLQSLPQEKMPQLVQIIKKRNEHLAQEGDEIELDIEALDTETLWELDRFVTNWKKMVSKTKRQALLMNLNPGSAFDVDGDGTGSEKNDSLMRPNNGEAGDEDVDIDDDMPVTSFPPVEIEKDEAGGGDGGGGDHDDDNNHGGNGSSSSSSSSGSSSDSSSSSDSDSGSSSGSDSGEDEAQS